MLARRTCPAAGGRRIPADCAGCAHTSYFSSMLSMAPLGAHGALVGTLLVRVLPRCTKLALSLFVEVIVGLILPRGATLALHFSAQGC